MSDFSFDDGFSKANQYSGKGRHREAEQLYRQCLLLRPDEEWILNNLGHSLVQLGRLQEAISVLQRVAHDHPNNLTAHANLAAAWEQSGQARGFGSPTTTNAYQTRICGFSFRPR